MEKNTELLRDLEKALHQAVQDLKEARVENQNLHKVIKLQDEQLKIGLNKILVEEKNTLVAEVQRLSSLVAEQKYKMDEAIELLGGDVDF